MLHYGSEIFEGLKAYRRADGKVQLFRPEENIRRLNSSADRMRLPLVDEKELLAALVKLIEIEQDWVPSSNGTSLYIRPFLFGNDETREILIFDTICSATSERQSAAISLAAQSDAMLIVGGKHSSNTKKLFKVCSEVCPLVYHIEDANEIPENLREFLKIDKTIKYRLQLLF